MRENNYAFIDGQNLNLGIKKMGWRLDYRKFRKYLAEKYSAEKAYLFIGFIPENWELYEQLRISGFILVFKTTVIDVNGRIKGNVDADLVLKAAVEIERYDRAIIVSSDGDFCSLVKLLTERNKLRTVLSPDEKNCSHLLRRAAQQKMVFMNDLRKRLEYKQKEGTS
jgi:uncharacterized LabA/DUF88 family protein